MPNRHIDTFRILLVEDNPGDVRLAREALRDSPIPSTLMVFSDGEDVMRYLRREGEHTQAPRPHIILLDLNLPGKSGGEILADIKNEPDLCRIPVIILTTSTAQRDVDATYTAHANSYVVKPLDIVSFAQTLRQIESFWFKVVTLPQV